MRLARENLAQEEAEAQNGVDLDSVMGDVDDDKTFAAMGVAKTIATVSFFFFFLLCRSRGTDDWSRRLFLR
jgi:hypothetical protein